ncbi:hypothetical protein UACE39S_03790 [Ureibacillus acetophenoni]
MENLNLILLGVGAVALVIALILLILKLSKENFTLNGVLATVLVVGATFLIAGFVIQPANFESAKTVSSKVEETTNLSGAQENGESNVNDSTGENNHSTNETNAPLYNTSMVAVINDDLTVVGSNPHDIASKLVEYEMNKQVGLRSWEITNIRTTSDNNVFNSSDYDKPTGDMRIVWIEGNVRATAADDGTTGDVGFIVELYQMAQQDSNWYVGKHWGALISLPVTKQPNYVEDERYFSNSSELIFDENGGLSSVNIPEYGQTFEEANPDKVTSEKDLIGAWYWREYDDFYMILRSDGSYSYIEKNAGFYADGIYRVKKMDDYYEVTVIYETGEKDSIMTIKLHDKNQFTATENYYSWNAKRVELAEVEGILKSVKGR